MKRYLLLIPIFLAVAADAIGQAESAIKKIDSLVSLAEYSKAITLLNQNFTQTKSRDLLAELQNKKIAILIMQGNLTEAESLLQQVNSVNEFIDAITLSNTGFLNLNKGRIDLALKNLQSAYAKFELVGKSNSKEASNCLSNMASVYLASGKYNQAEEFEIRALQLRQKVGGEFSEEVAASYNNLGLIYLNSDPEKALTFYEKALAVYQKFYSAGHPKIAIANTNIGICYMRLELYGDATNSFDVAKKTWEQIYPEGHPNTAIVLGNLGSINAKLKNTAAAISYYEKALAIYQRAYGQKHPEIARIFIGLGNLSINDSKFKEGLIFFQKGLISNSPVFGSNDLTINPTFSDYYNATVQVYLLHAKAKALESQYLRKTIKLTDLKLALKCLYSSDSLIDDIRHHSSDEGDKLALGELSSEVYEDGVSICHLISENVIDPTPYREKAFYFAEKSKSAVLQESIADTQAKAFSGIPSELLEQEKNIKSTIDLYNQKLAQKPSTEDEKKIRELLFASNSAYEAFVKKLEKDFPNYFNLKFSQSTATIRDVQETLDDQTAVVSYFIAEKAKRIFQFIITKYKFSVANLSEPENFNRLLTGFTNSLLYNDFDTYRQTGNSINSLLEPKVSAKIKELIVVPAGRLGTMPFEAIPLTKVTEGDFAKVDYWVGRFAISYEFSVSLLLQKNKAKTTVSNPTIFLCAPINFAERDNLNNLPGTEQEVNAIAQLFGANVTAKKYLEANETLIKSPSIASYSYLHFATHGIVDEVNPESSKIFLSSTSTDDGNLYAGEIYNLSLNANLSVLSACQTGLGKISKGEGVIGLSRALTYAGSKNIIVSFWSVNDESTTQLMTDFYRNLLGQPSPHFNLALRESKLRMIKSRTHASPYYWAPFVLIGR